MGRSKEEKQAFATPGVAVPTPKLWETEGTTEYPTEPSCLIQVLKQDKYQWPHV